MTLARVRQQLTLNYSDLSVDHTVEIQLTAASKGNVFRGVGRLSLARN
jgi:hypothetical protein